MVSVCVGDAFGTDADGKLILLLDGNPPEVNNPWPAGCNPARVDPNGGLWVPPDHEQFFDVSETFESLADVDVSGGVNLLTVSFDVTNPSDCRDMRLAIFVHYDVEKNIAAGDAMGIYVAVDDGGGTLDGPNRTSRTPNPMFPAALPPGENGTEMWALEETALRVGLLDPGETKTLRARVRADSNTGLPDTWVSRVTIKFRVFGWTRG